MKTYNVTTEQGSFKVGAHNLNEARVIARMNLRLSAPYEQKPDRLVSVHLAKD